MTAESNDYAPDTSWFAVWTQSRQEKIAAAMLESLGVIHFLPLKSAVHRWSDRNQTVSTPLFNGYLFVRLNPSKDSKLQVLKAPGVAGLVGNQTGPLPIPDYEIENIRIVIAQKVQYCASSSIPVGNRVRVMRGVLAGVEGTLLRTHDDSKLVISIEMIQQSVVVSISASDVEPIGIPYSSGFHGTPVISMA